MGDPPTRLPAAWVDYIEIVDCEGQFGTLDGCSLVLAFENMMTVSSEP
jgi:hypothetical protein